METRFSPAPALLAAFAFLLSSCAFSGFATSPRQAPFEESEFAAYGHTGSGSVTGQLAVTSSDGVVHAGSADQGMAGINVTLIPVTAYTKEMVEREIGNGENLSPSDPRFKKYVRHARTDANGHFSLSQVPPGEYFLAGLGEWVAFGEFEYQWACERIKVGNGQAVKVKLTHNLQRPGRPLLVLPGLE